MEIGASLYSYRNNFSCKHEKVKNPYKKSYRVKLVDLFRPGYRRFSIYEDDLFVGICQWLMAKGYPQNLSLTKDTKEIEKYLIDALFSVDMFYAQHLYINKNGFDLLKWREQFDIFIETHIKGLNYYRRRSLMPLKDFTSFDDVKNLILNGENKYSRKAVTMVNREKGSVFFSEYNMGKATYILGFRIMVYKDHYVYEIITGWEDDYEDMKKGLAHSSWEIRVRSRICENFIDFCLRIYNNFNAIIQGDSNVLKEYDCNTFELIQKK